MSEVDVRGRTPNNLISRAVSHEVGGDGSDEIWRVGGGESTSHDMNGSSGLEGLSLRVIVTVTLIAHHALLYSSLVPIRCGLFIDKSCAEFEKLTAELAPQRLVHFGRRHL